jgi:hypothetical protein
MAAPASYELIDLNIFMIMLVPEQCAEPNKLNEYIKCNYWNITESSLQTDLIVTAML